MPRDLTQAANQYASRNHLVVREVLGAGIHGLVQVVQAALESYGVNMLDVNPGNVVFGD